MHDSIPLCQIGIFGIFQSAMVGRDVPGAPRPRGRPRGRPQACGPPGTSAPTTPRAMQRPCPAPRLVPPRHVRTHGRARRPRRAAPTGTPTGMRAAGDVGPYHAPRHATPMPRAVQPRANKHFSLFAPWLHVSNMAYCLHEGKGQEGRCGQGRVSEEGRGARRDGGGRAGAARNLKEKRWKLEEERRRNRLNERRIRKLEDELRRLKGGRLSG